MTQVKTTLRSAYLAGPMRGYEEYNFPAFRRETAWLRGEGWTVFSPAERDESDPDINHEENVAGWTGSRGLDYFMAHDLKAVCEMDAVICLPGWENSQGARLETITAVEIGHPVFVIAEKRSRPNGKFLLDKWLESVDPDYIRAVFAARGVPEHELSSDCWCQPEREDFRDETEIEHRGAPKPVLSGTIHAPFACQCGGALTEGCEGYTPVDPPDSALPTGSQARKDVPLASGVLDYFPAALAEIARVSKAGNDKHNPGQPMHHARAKSTDHADCLLRHLVDRGKTDPETGQRHSAEVAWRALALLQQELEDAGLAPLPRGAKL